MIHLLKQAAMKICRILLLVTLSLFTVSVYAQNKSKQKTKTSAKQEVATKYYCPMKCEGDKTYDKAGKCPKCGMNLKEDKATTLTYSCPMKCEGDRKYDKPGKCPKCGMALTQPKKTEG